MKDDELSLEDLLVDIFERLETLETFAAILAERVDEVETDHKAFFMTLRSTGKLSKDTFRRFRSMLVKEQREEEDASSEADDRDVEGDGGGQGDSE